jgi:hypothetical protein
MTVESNHPNKEVREIGLLINDIEGLHCFGVWKDRIRNQYHTVVMTGRRDSDRIVKEIQTVLFYLRSLRISDQNIYLVKTLQDFFILSPRIEYVNCDPQDTANEYSIDVTLRLLERVETGYAKGTPKKKDKLRIVSEATVDAIKKLIPGPYELRILDVFPIDVVPEEVREGEIIISLITLVDKDERIHCGAALKRKDDVEAAIRTTLDAMNRYLDLLLNQFW